MFDVLDDWVVIAVKHENSACQEVAKEIAQSVNEGQLHLDAVVLPHVDLNNLIDTIEFYEGPPQYMLEVKPPTTLEYSRFSLDSLSLIYRQLRSHADDSNLIDV